MKKKITVIVAVLLSVVLVSGLAYMIGTGFDKRSDVYLLDYSLSEDGTELRFSVFVSSSMGYVRCFREETVGGERRLAFLSTFGGLGSSCGAENEFILELNKGDTCICFCGYDGAFFPVLQKNAETGEWMRP